MRAAIDVARCPWCRPVRSSGLLIERLSILVPDQHNTIRAGRNRCVAAGLSTRVTLTFHQHELTTLVLMPCGHLTQSSPLPRCPLNHGPALRNDQC